MSNHTIWGPIQTSVTIAEGIRCVTTALHGGYILSQQRLTEMPAAFPQGAHGQFEEDLAWCFVVLAFPHFFSDALSHDAAQTCKDWFPHEWETWTGTTLSVEDSSAKRTEAWYQAHAKDWLVISA